MKNKTGQYKGIVLVILVIVLIFAVAFSSIFAYDIIDQLKPDMDEEFTINNNTAALSAIDEVHSRFPATWDAIIAFMFFLLWAFLTISAFKAQESPVFFILMLVIGIFVIIASIMMGNFYEELFTDSSVSTLTSNFPMTNWILSNMLIVSIVMVISVLIGLYVNNTGAT